MTAERKGKTSLAELAELVEGCVSGDPSTLVSGVATLDIADRGQISFLANPKYQSQLSGTDASAIIVHPSLYGTVSKPLILTENPYLAFAKILTWFAEPPAGTAGVSEMAFVHPDADVGANVTISEGCSVAAGVSIGSGTFLYPNVVVGHDVVIGQQSLIHANVTIRERCKLGNRVILQPNTVIGSDGFGYAPDGQAYYKIPQVGHVVIEDDVEIGSCTCVDRGTMGITRIRRGTKIDNLVQIAHNVDVGEDTVIVAQVAIAGSTTIGRHCTFGGQSGANGHIKIGDNVTVAARGGISNNIEGPQVVAGFPSMPHREWLKSSKTFGHLPDMRRELNRLKKQVCDLEKKLSEDDESI